VTVIRQYAHQIADNDLALSTGAARSWPGRGGPLHLFLAPDGFLDASNRSGGRRLGTWATATTGMASGLATFREDLVERLAQLVWHFGGGRNVLLEN
jgi:hypothetical protein